MKPLNSFKKWLLNILVPYIEGTNKKKEDKKMSLIKVGIIVEIFLFVGFFLWVRKLNRKQSRQPSLSKKTIKNLKF